METVIVREESTPVMYAATVDQGKIFAVLEDAAMQFIDTKNTIYRVTQAGKNTGYAAGDLILIKQAPMCLLSATKSGEDVGVAVFSGYEVIAKLAKI